MAVKQPTVTRSGNKVTYFWEEVTESDTCSPIKPHMAMLGQLQIKGTFGGASVALQASEDEGTTWTGLSDSANNTIAITAAGGAGFDTGGSMIRPHATGGTGQDLDISLTVPSEYMLA